MKDDPSISINEIFYSIQGEAKNSGKPTVLLEQRDAHLTAHTAIPNMLLRKESKLA